jgi:hypothetical protein
MNTYKHFQKIICLTLVAFLTSTIIATAQTTIDDVQEGSYLQIGAEVNSRPVFAGQSLGITGIEILPAIAYHHASGWYASLATATYTDASILKKTKIAEANTTIGYQYNTEKYNGDYSFSNSQVFYGNKFFKGYLANCFSAENSINITDNLEVQLNGLFLFGAKIKRNNAVVLEGNVQYHIYIDEALGAEQLRISPSISYFYGSDKLASTFGDRDSLSTTNKKVDINNAMHTLSYMPGVEVGWQSGHHELEFSFALPLPNTTTLSTTLPVVSTSAIKASTPLFSLRYNLYIGRGNND